MIKTENKHKTKIKPLPLVFEQSMENFAAPFPGDLEAGR